MSAGCFVLFEKLLYFSISMKNLILVSSLFFLNLLGHAQNSSPTSQSNSGLSFYSFLSGVKYAEIITTEELEQNISNSPNSYQVYLGVAKHLQSLAFSDIGFSSKIYGLEVASMCEIARVLVTYDVYGSYVHNFAVTFYSCDDEWWQFKSKSPFTSSGYVTLTDRTSSKFQKMYGSLKPVYSNYHSRKLPSEKTKWTESELKIHFKEKGADAIEGIYERTSQTQYTARYKVGIIKEGNEYKMVYLDGALNYIDWIEGEVKADLIKTATSSLFKLNWRMRDKSISEDPYATFESGFLYVIWPDRDKGLYVKLFPIQSDNSSTSSNAKSSGTGFAISSDGFIVTNYHVVEGAQIIKVRGIKGNFSKTYNAEIIIEDKNNDIAIIKIDEPDFTNFGTVPYTINSDITDVGSSVYALGYPLLSSMGDEVKLTNGIISSKTGFQGDITTYQISVPVQPGNSGGPLFNSKGEIVGIISSKHMAAENASYAIKTNYLKNLIQAMNIAPTLPSNNTISNKGLSEQVKFVKEFVYILEIN
jgi:S1-C subfamily serine protease